VYEDKADADIRRYQKEISKWRAASEKPTCFQIFCAEMSPALVQQDPGKYTGDEGKAKLTRDLKAQWLRLDQSGWLEFDRKAQLWTLQS